MSKSDRQQVILSLVALFVCWATAVAQAPRSIDTAYVEAHFAAARGAEASSHFAEAARDYDSILRRYPSELPALYQNAGIAYYLDHQYQAAIDRFEKGLRLQPRMTGSNLFLGAAYLYNGRPSQALPHLLLADRAKPSIENAHYLGLTYNALGNYRQAAAYFRFSLEHAGGDEKEKYLSLLLETYINLATKTGNNLVDRFPDSVQTHLMKGEVLDRQGLYRVAAQEYLRAATLDPYYATVFFLLAPDLKRLELDSLARFAIARYSAITGATSTLDVPQVEAGLKPKDVDDTFDYAAALRNLPPPHSVAFPLADSQVNHLTGDSSGKAVRAAWTEVAASFAKLHWPAAIEAIQNLPASETAWTRAYLLGAAYLGNDQPHEADRALAKLSDQIERVPSLLKLQWEVYERIAAIYADDLLLLHPNSAGAHFLRAQALHARGSPEAETEYRLAIAADPRRSEIRIGLADYYLARSSLTAALETLKQELEISPQSAEANARLGEVYLKLNQPRDAIRFLQVAVELDAKNPVVHSNLGKTWETLGDYHQATMEYERSLEFNPAQNRLHFVLSTLYAKLGNIARSRSELLQFQAARAREDEQLLNQAHMTRNAMIPEAANPSRP